MAVVATVTAGDMIGGLAVDYRIVVATRTFPINLSVIDLRYRRETHRGMAILAEARRAYMRDVPSCRGDAVMAAGTTGIDPEVIEKHRKPTGRPMAAVALFLRRRMVRRLADALHIVVATRATAEDRIVVHFDQREPFAAAVAVLAEIRAKYMISGFGSCVADSSANRVAASTFRRSPLKYGTDMAALTIGREVRPVEPEAGRQVIEGRLCFGQTGKARPQNQYQCKQAFHCSGFKSAKDVVRWHAAHSSPNSPR